MSRKELPNSRKGRTVKWVYGGVAVSAKHWTAFVAAIDDNSFLVVLETIRLNDQLQKPEQKEGVKATRVAALSIRLSSQSI